jgi:uncharacterized protein
MNALNVLGTALQACSYAPLTGYFRDGCCHTREERALNFVTLAELQAHAWEPSNPFTSK